MSQNDWRRAPSHAHRHSGEFRDRAEIVVAQLHVGGAPGIVHGLERLQRDKDDRDRELPAKDAEGRGRRIGGHVDKENVDVFRKNLRKNSVSIGGLVDKPEVGDREVVFPEARFKHPELAMHFRKQSVELVPVGVMADGEKTGFAGQWFDA